MIRYFQIRSPRPDFTGRIGGVSFADGVARVSFDDARDGQGVARLDEHQVQVGRSMVLFARNNPVYQVVEVDATGNPIADIPAEHEPVFDGGPHTPARSASKADWVAYAAHEDRGTLRLMPDTAEALTRDQLADKFLGPKEA